MALHSSGMRLVCFVFGLVVLAVGSAGAGTSRVVVMTDADSAPALQSALRVALGGKLVVVASAIPPSGPLRLDRAAIAQHEAIAARADAAVWIDVEGEGVDVCVVSADGRHFRHAPLPAGDASPRVVAAIAKSLLDELVAPPEGDPTIDVDVHVSVGRKGVEVTTSPNAQVVVDDPFGARRPGAAAPGPELAPPGATSITPPGATAMRADVSAQASSGPMRANRTLVELGPMLSPVSAGVEAELMFPASPAWRFGVMAVASILFMDNNDPLFAGAFEIRHIGSGRRRHIDIGLLGGAATAEGDSVAMAALRFQVTWENQSRSTALALLPCVLVADGDVIPGAWASLRWGLPI